MAISEDQKAQLRALHAGGHTRNEIVRRLDIAAGSVTNICRADPSRARDA